MAQQALHQNAARANSHVAPRAVWFPYGNAHTASILLCGAVHSGGRCPLASFSGLGQGVIEMIGTRILGIVGSLRKGSYNCLSLKAAQELLPEGAVL